MELVRSICADWEAGRYADVSWADPDIEYVIADGPAPGTWRGLAGMGQAWGDFLGAWEDARIRVAEYRELGDGGILVLFSRQGHGKTSGLDLGAIQSQGATVFHFRDGRVARLALYHEQRNALADLDTVEP
jgi:ketosteroid isomerase-like protein